MVGQGADRECPVECRKIGPPPALQRPSSRPPARDRPRILATSGVSPDTDTTDVSMQSHRNQEMSVHCFLLSEIYPEYVFGRIIQCEDTVKITFLEIDNINISPESTPGTVAAAAAGTLISDTTLYPRQ